MTPPDPGAPSADPVRFVSTRGEAGRVGFGEAMERGLAPDGGLYVPSRFPESVEEPATADLRGTARAVLRPFLAGDELDAHLDEIVDDALTFPVPLVEEEAWSVLELYHGPTAAFKDVGARFMAACFARRPGPLRTVLVATSGDTGSAVASAFHRRPGFRVAVLFPEQGVSPRQRHLLTCFGDNVRSFAVQGTFDDAQAVLKAALRDEELTRRHRLTTANSINLARLLPQVAYHASAAWRYRARHGSSPTLVVPSGNLGNALAALWAREVGAPVDRVVLATNANRTVADFMETGRWEPRTSTRTLANAMDVGDPSNMERMAHLAGGVSSPERAATELSRLLDVVPVDDETIREIVAETARGGGRILDPHTATAVHAVRVLEPDHPVLAATAHPAKFDDVVAPLVERPVPLPRTLTGLLERPSRSHPLEPAPEGLARALAEWTPPERRA